MAEDSVLFHMRLLFLQQSKTYSYRQSRCRVSYSLFCSIGISHQPKEVQIAVKSVGCQYLRLRCHGPSSMVPRIQFLRGCKGRTENASFCMSKHAACVGAASTISISRLQFSTFCHLHSSTDRLLCKRSECETTTQDLINVSTTRPVACAQVSAQ